MSDKVEKRHTIEAAIRAGDDSKRVVQGYAAVFNKVAKITERLHEKIAPGAFKNSIGGDIRALWSHNTDLVIGRTTNDSLKLSEDDTGLRFELSLPDTTQGRDAYTLIKDGYVSGVSFGFRVKKDAWDRGQDGQPHLRTLLDVDLLEISPTPFPAYGETMVSARSSEELLKEKESEWLWAEKEGKKPSLDSLRSELQRLQMKFALDSILIQ